MDIKLLTHLPLMPLYAHVVTSTTNWVMNSSYSESTIVTLCVIKYLLTVSLLYTTIPPSFFC